MKSRFDPLRRLPRLAITLARDPVAAMRAPWRLSFVATFALQITAAVISSVLNAMIERSWLDLAIGVLVFPLAAVMISAIWTLFVYYFFSIFAHTFLDIRRVHSIIVIATLPYFVLHAFSGFLPALDLIGFALTTCLVTVGIVEQFGIGKKTAITMSATLFAVFFIVWSIVQYATAS